MELHDKGKFVCKILRLVPLSKTKPVKQFGSSTPLEVHGLYQIVIPKDSGVKPYLGAQFSIFADEAPTQPAQPIQVNSVASTPQGDVREIEFH